MRKEQQSYCGRNSLYFFLLTILGFFYMTNVFAQDVSIKGRVCDVAGESIIGASVSVKGTTLGTVTDFDGNFTMNVPSKSELVISYVGYISQQVAISGKNFLQIVLKEDQKALDEVVVIGYGSVKKKDATGSVTSIDIDEKNKGQASSPQELLGGKVAGVSVVSAGGAPGSNSTIRIRGGSSLSASNDPLIVIDGVIMSNEKVGGLTNALSSLNPNDIESFTVLKDASATAIYGSRASNGVILITTKKGSSDKVKINYNGMVSVSQARNRYDVLSGDEYRDFISNLSGVTPSMLSALSLYENQNTDWQDEVLRTAVSTEHNISAFGTVKEWMPYRVSAGYTNQNGILKTSNFERYTGNMTLTPILLDEHLKLSLNAKATYIKNRFADAGAMSSAVFFDPTKPVKNESSLYEGYYAWTTDGMPDGTLTGSAPINPVAMLKLHNDGSKVKALIGSVKADYKVHGFEDLSYNVNVAYDYSNSKGNNYVSPNSPSSFGDEDKSGSLSLYEDTFINKLIETYAQYNKDLSSIDSHFDIMGGYSYQSYSKEGNSVKYYLSRNSETYGEKTTERDAYKEYGPEKYVLLSFFGRLNYTLKDRYLFTFTLRDDASSRFAKKNRWGLFPALALGWRMKDESFLKDVKPLSDLKLRLGWGKTGQQAVGGYYPSTLSYSYGKGGAMYPTYDAAGNVEWLNVIKPNAVNPDLKWEETTTWNIGLDYGFLNNRISGGIDFYKRKTNDLLNESVNIPAGTDFAELIVANIGSLENKGVEFSINATPISTKNLNWNIGFNVAYNDSKITELTFNDALSSTPGFRFESTGGDGAKTVKIHSVGHAPGAFYVYEQIYDQNGKPIEGAYVDRNNDGVINDDDLRQYKNADADVLMGFNSSVRYKNWDFGFNGRVSLGNYMYNSVASNNGDMNTSQLFANNSLKNRLKYSFDANFSQKQRLSDYYVQNASFLKIDNITLGYTFDGKIAPRVYATVQNPIVITKYKGLDPEIQNGIDRDLYPRPIMFLLGVNLNF